MDKISKTWTWTKIIYFVATIRNECSLRFVTSRNDSLRLVTSRSEFDRLFLFRYETNRNGLDCIGLDWIGLVLVLGGLDWIGLVLVLVFGGLDWIGLGAGASVGASASASAGAEYSSTRVLDRSLIDL